MKRVKNQFEASLLMSKESTNGRMQKLGSDILSLNKIISDKEVTRRISEVTKADVMKLAQNIFDKSKPTFAAVGKVKDLRF
jgi:predicted Zn-dependent peptidase